MALRWDAGARRWRNDGKLLNFRQTAGLRDELADLYTQYIREETLLYRAGKLEYASWVANTENYVLQATGNGYTFGRGGIANLTDADYDRLARTLNTQSGLFRRFAAEVEAGSLSGPQIQARAESYGGSVVYAHEQATQQAAISADTDADWDLPFYPGDGETQCLARCFTGDVIVESAELSGAYSRPFDGEVVIIETAGGNKLTATPNHPVLTWRGWVPIGDLTQSDRLVRASIRDEVRASQPNVHNVPAEIREVFHATRNAWNSQRAMGSVLDFHGDGSDREVDVVLRGGDLPIKRYPAFVQQGREFVLTSADRLREVSILAERMQRQFLGRLFANTGRCIRCGSQGLAIVGAGLGHAQIHRFASASSLNSTFQQLPSDRSPVNAKRERKSEFTLSGEVSTNNGFDRHLGMRRRSGIPKLNTSFLDAISDRSAANAETVGDAIHRLAGQVTFDDVIVVRRQSFHGNVYNLQTDSGWYIASGVIVHNCRCAWEIDEDEYGWTCTYHTMRDDRVCPDCSGRRRQYGEGSPLVFPKAGAPIPIRDLVTA